MTGKTYKFVQINIYKGKYLNDLLDFLKSENPDFISMQEVTSGELNFAKIGSDLFAHIKRETGYDGVCSVDITLSDGKGTMGNAVFSKFKILSNKAIFLKEKNKYTKDQVNDPRFFPFLPRHLLDVAVQIGSEKFRIMSWHGAWTAPPTDTVETLRQSQIVSNHLKSLKEPFIMGGDLNAIPQSKTVGNINRVARNLMMDSGILATTNVKIHKIAPRAYLVDYIFTSSHFDLVKLSVPNITVSDHLPVIASIEYKG